MNMEKTWRRDPAIWMWWLEEEVCIEGIAQRRRDAQVSDVEGVSDKDCGGVHEEELDPSDPAGD